MVRQDLDFGKALQDPRAIFGTPERVLGDPRLDRQGKREILKNWEQDEREMAVAEEEGMAGGEHGMLDRVVKALDSVSHERPRQSVGATKHGGDVTGEAAGPEIKELMREIDEVVHVDESLREAHVRMERFHLPFLPVADGDEIVGIVTACDVHNEPSAEGRGVPRARVRDHLSREIAYCYETDDVALAKRVMERSGHSRLLVTDEDGLLVGLITIAMIDGGIRRGISGQPYPSKRESTRRIAKTSARAKGDRPGRPWGYSVKPQLKT